MGGRGRCWVPSLQEVFLGRQSSHLRAFRKLELGEHGRQSHIVLTLSLPVLKGPAPPTNLSLGFAHQPVALRASWCHPPGGRDAFQLRLYRLRPLTLESEKILSQEAQNFSWAQLPAGCEFQVQLSTLWGLEESSSANATGWTREFSPSTVSFPSLLLSGTLRL